MKKNYSKNYSIWLLTIFIGISIIISVYRNFSTLEKEEELDKKPISTFVPSPLDFNNQTEGPIILEILTPISYIGGSYVETGAKNWISRIEKARKDPKVTGLILRINSPGGSVGASQEIYQALSRFREAGKPIVTSVIDICASGAYYAAATSNYIVANSGSVIGSIGVILTTADFIELYKKIGVRFNTIQSGKFKDILSPAREITQEEREHLQKLVDYSYQAFLDDILKWRAKDNKARAEKITKAANGLIYTSQDAIDIGLIDAQGDLEAAKKKMAELLDIPYEKLKIRNSDENILRRFGIKIPIINKFVELLTKLTDLIPASNKGLEYKH